MMGGHGSPYIVKAQASKDATMAYFILKNQIDGKIFLHYKGAYHSNDFEGILWYVKNKKPQLSFGTITTVSQENVFKLEEENKGKADYTIVVDVDMTTTY